jgi:hypothetical protein
MVYADPLGDLMVRSFRVVISKLEKIPEQT